MAITGCLTDFSLAEIFQFIEKGHKTGLLTLRALSESQARPHGYYIWVCQGRIVAAANRLDHQGLVSLIDQRQWVSDRVFDKVVHWCCPIDEPLGLYLKNQGVLQAEQLKRLFQIQVLQQVCALFQIKDAQFRFDPNVPIPTREMTGLSVPATEATLVGLRVLRKWDALIEKLPDPDAGLISVIDGKPQYRLDAQEWQVWEYTNGTVALKSMARHLRLPLEKVQQGCFPAYHSESSEEVPLLAATNPTPADETPQEQVIEETERQNVSQSFMQNLVGFLRSKVLTQQSLTSC
jgi:hypothetical protein